MSLLVGPVLPWTGTCVLVLPPASTANGGGVAGPGLGVHTDAAEPPCLCPADALMRKAFGSSSFNPNVFLTRLLIHMGLLKVQSSRPRGHLQLVWVMGQAPPSH